MKYPLSSSLFPPIPLDISVEEQQRFVALADSLVADRIDEYDAHLYDQQEVVDLRAWRLLKQKESISVYQHQASHATYEDADGEGISRSGGDSHLSYLLGLGSIVGKLDDALYGMLATTSDEMKIRSSYIEDRLVDATVLRRLVPPSLEDPLRFVGLKWMVKRPVMQTFVRDRDFLFLESIGTRLNSRGERIGYFLLHSVELKGFPTFESLQIVRGKISFCYLYRQRDESTVDCFLRGVADPNGRVPAKIVALSAAEGLISSWRAIQSCEMRKFAHMLRLSSWRGKHFRGKSLKKSTGVGCHLCAESFSFLSTGRVCQLCRHSFCSRCSVDKKMSFLVDGSIDNITRRKVAFCMTCILNVKQTSARRFALHQLLLEQPEGFKMAKELNLEYADPLSTSWIEDNDSSSSLSLEADLGDSEDDSIGRLVHRAW